MNDPDLNITSAANGREAPSDPQGYAALRTGAGVRLCGERTVVRVVGDDRASFLHGMCSADIRGLVCGRVTAALFLTEHAHVIGEAVIWALPDALIIEMERESWPAVRDHLERFLIADDVEMEESAGECVIEADGPLAADVVAGAYGKTAAAREPWQHIEAPGGFRVAAVTRYGVPAYSIISSRAHASGQVARMISAAAGHEVREVSFEATEIVRVENGTARASVDATGKTIALEARMESAISFTKGCYIGQETVERATARGALKKRLMGLKVAGARMPEAGAQAIVDSKEVGRLTSQVRSPRLGILALCILHHSAWTPGTPVTVRDRYGDLPATVSDLPFADD